MISSIPIPAQVAKPERTIATSNPSPSPIPLIQEPDYITTVPAPGAMMLTNLENPRHATHRHFVTMIHATTSEEILVDLLTCGDSFSTLRTVIRGEFTSHWVIHEILPIDEFDESSLKGGAES